MKNNWNINEQPILNSRIFPELEPATERLLLIRGIKTKKQKRSFFVADYEKDSHDPFLMFDMDKAVNRLLQAIKNKETVCVFGDYDADGVTASVMLLDFFQQININTISYIPDRNKEGYGLNNKAIDYIKKKGASLIITVDCGISNEKEVDYASKLEIDSIILDHHHVPSAIPRAIAVVDPKRNGDAYPDKNLAGVGVAFKFIQAVASKISKYDKQQLKWFLDIVAIGTIADCVPLIGENRMLAKYGLLVLSKTKRVGLRQLFHVGRIAISESRVPSAEVISFQIAPRINAAGRMDHASIAQELLLCKAAEESTARLLALDLEDKNNHRQKVTKEVVRQVRKQYLGGKKPHNIIIATSPHWELGIVGLASGKITEEFRKPSILLKEFDEYFKGSGRSVRGFNLIEALERQKDLLVKYGGHPRAAGFEITKQNFELFTENIQCDADSLPKDLFVKQITIDLDLSINELNLKFLDELDQFGPFGEKNRCPLFLTSNLRIIRKRTVGNGEAHLKLICADNDDSNTIVEAIGFGIAKDYQSLSEGDKINLVYRLERNIWNGKESIQARIEDIEL
ncbi:MAG: single-stranded-DNA-specific exonuclease RecJ [Patescibacteria group bacterium]|nr:single-stranded-DNA-specific exonuclease RecJ [Patescibacteria group bacterium]